MSYRVKHGETRRVKGKHVQTPEWNSFIGMRNRCLNPNQDRFKDYGERGISICDRWLNGEDGMSAFSCFVLDMGRKPDPKMSLERKNNELGYSPNNCVWGTDEDQARNTRANRLVTIGDETMALVAAVEKFGKVSYGTACMRIHRGWDDLSAILLPLGSAKPN